MDLRSAAELVARAVPAYDVPPIVETRVLAAVERAATGPLTSPGRRLGRLVPVAVAAALVAGAVVAGTRLDHGGGSSTLELEAVLRPPGGGADRATVTVRKAGFGRLIAFRSDDMPILPAGEYYELWFVGRGDTLARPNRISAGTFHPDERWRSKVDLTAAVDPALYPVLSVTSEPADGDPARTGPEVLRSRASKPGSGSSPTPASRR